MSHTVITPEISRAKRTNMRAMIHVLLLKYMNTIPSNKVKYADFKKWLGAEYRANNPHVVDAQKYYVEAGFTGKSSQGLWYGGPYFFWQFERLERWVSGIEQVTISKENNRIMLTQKLASHVG